MKVQKWINVNDRLPEELEQVLIYVESVFENRIETAIFCKDEIEGNNKKPYSWKAPAGPMTWFGQYAKYWMPLPKPPKA